MKTFKPIKNYQNLCSCYLTLVTTASFTFRRIPGLLQHCCFLRTTTSSLCEKRLFGFFTYVSHKFSFSYILQHNNEHVQTHYARQHSKEQVHGLRCEICIIVRPSVPFVAKFYKIWLPNPKNRVILRLSFSSSIWWFSIHPQAAVIGKFANDNWIFKYLYKQENETFANEMPVSLLLLWQPILGHKQVAEIIFLRFVNGLDKVR